MLKVTNISHRDSLLFKTWYYLSILITLKIIQYTEKIDSQDKQFQKQNMNLVVLIQEINKYTGTPLQYSARDPRHCTAM